jgi:hypothetical protein
MKNSALTFSRPGRTRMHYVTPQITQEAKTYVRCMCPGALFVKTAPSPPEHEK